jgi:hypothetical protein
MDFTQDVTLARLRYSAKESRGCEKGESSLEGTIATGVLSGHKRDN